MHPERHNWCGPCGLEKKEAIAAGKRGQGPSSSNRWSRSKSQRRNGKAGQPQGQQKKGGTPASNGGGAKGRAGTGEAVTPPVDPQIAMLQMQIRLLDKQISAIRGMQGSEDSVAQMVELRNTYRTQITASKPAGSQVAILRQAIAHRETKLARLNSRAEDLRVQLEAVLEEVVACQDGIDSCKMELIAAERRAEAEQPDAGGEDPNAQKRETLNSLKAICGDLTLLEHVRHAIGLDEEMEEEAEVGAFVPPVEPLPVHASSPHASLSLSAQFLAHRNGNVTPKITGPRSPGTPSQYIGTPPAATPTSGTARKMLDFQPGSPDDTGQRGRAVFPRKAGAPFGRRSNSVPRSAKYDPYLAH